MKWGCCLRDVGCTSVSVSMVIKFWLYVLHSRCPMFAFSMVLSECSSRRVDSDYIVEDALHFPVFHWMHAVMQNCGTCFCDILDMYECFVTVWSRQLLASLADVKSHRSSVLNWRTIVIRCVIKHCVHILLKIALVSSEKNLYCWHNLFYFVINISLLFDTVRS